MTTETQTLTDFLLARIAVDEHVAREADRVGVSFMEVDPGFGSRTDDGPRSAWQDRFDPARVLAECEAKRRIVEGMPAPLVIPGVVAAPTSEAGILRLLALPYADHPDYREEWRP